MTDLYDQAQDIFCNRLARIDTLGPNRRLIFTMPSVDGPGTEAVVVKLIVSAELLTEIAYMASGADRDTVSALLVACEAGRAN
jgi:hypothetical protein